MPSSIGGNRLPCLVTLAHPFLSLLLNAITYFNLIETNQHIDAFKNMQSIKIN